MRSSASLRLTVSAALACSFPQRPTSPAPQPWWSWSSSVDVCDGLYLLCLLSLPGSSPHPPPPPPPPTPLPPQPTHTRLPPGTDGWSWASHYLTPGLECHVATLSSLLISTILHLPSHFLPLYVFPFSLTVRVMTGGLQRTGPASAARPGDCRLAVWVVSSDQEPGQPAS